MTQSQRPIVEEVDTNKLAEAIRKHAPELQNEEQLKIRVESTLRPIPDKWGIRWAAYEHRHEISGRKDALYGRAIIEYKEPGVLDSKSEFRKAKDQVKKYITSEAGEPKDFGRYFGVLLDGNKISFVRASPALLGSCLGAPDPNSSSAHNQSLYSFVSSCTVGTGRRRRRQ